LHRVRFSLGDSNFPRAAVQYGSQTMLSVGSSIALTANMLRDRAIRTAVLDPGSPLNGQRPDDITVTDGRIHLRTDPARGETYQDLLRRRGLRTLDAEQTYRPDDANTRYSMHSYGAVFAEVAVDELLGTGPQSLDIEQGYGLSEEIIGRWLSQRSRRERIVLATKVYQPMGTGPNDRRLSAYHIRKACEDSLRRLQTDHIDLYQMHHIDRRTPWEEVWQAMELLVQQGKVIYVGSSNFAGWDIATAQAAASARHFMGLVSEQSLYNLTSRTIELEVIPACRHYGLGVIPWSPLGGGLLGGALAKETDGRRADMGQAIERHRPQLEAYEALCQQLGERPSDVALAWLLHNPVVTTPITRPRSPAAGCESASPLAAQPPPDQRSAATAHPRP
jgi:aryl-alcohol dehydrogenase-like predicted oxidoreductase